MVRATAHLAVWCKNTPEGAHVLLFVRLGTAR